MLPEARSTYDSDVVPGNRPGGSDVIPTSLQMYRGVMGWKDDNTHFDVGTSSNGGRTLLKITLNRGKHITSGEPTQGGADGFQVLGQTMGPLHWIPPIGTPVLVCFPDGDIEAPGAAVIVGTLIASPPNQFGKNTAKFDFGPNQRLFLKAKEIVLSDYNNNFIQITENGVIMNNSTGCGIQMSNLNDPSSPTPTANPSIVMWTTDSGEGNNLLRMTKDGVQLNVKTTAGQTHIDIGNGNFHVFAEQSTWINGGTNYIGKAPLVGTPALVGLTGVSGVPSTSVFISVT